jgi:hypothetical protein
LVLLPDGAVAAGARAAALGAIDHGERLRRETVGLGAVRSLPLLDTLLNLPLLCPIALSDISAREERLLRTAPIGTVEFDERSVMRTIQVPLTVAAAVVEAATWRAALRKCAAFAPFAQRIVVLPKAPSDSVVWEAQVAGVGIWLDHGGSLEEYLAAETFVPRYFKAAGWRFAEQAYGALCCDGDSRRRRPVGACC